MKNYVNIHAKNCISSLVYNFALQVVPMKKYKVGKV